MPPLSSISFVAAALFAALTTPAFAQLSITSFTIDGGGGTSTGGVFTLSGTIGQPDAGRQTASPYSCSGGYWGGGGAASCVADFDDGSGLGHRDGGVTIDDLLYYLVIFGDGSVAADVDDGSSTNSPDGGVTIEDLLYFLVRFEAGC